MRFFPISLGVLLLVGFGATTNAQANNSTAVPEALAKIEQWVETKRIYSREAADWKLERSILQDTETLLENELARLEGLIAELEESATSVDEARGELTAAREREATSANVVTEALAGLETRLKTSLQRFPRPLLDQIQPLVRRIPDNPEETRLSIGERVQNIVGILGEAAKFNGALTLTSEVREMEDGRSVEVRTLYWGLAAAYYVDAGGRIGGVGYPSADGWEWPRMDDEARAIRDLIEVYEGTGEIRFVEVPARIRN